MRSISPSPQKTRDYDVSDSVITLIGLTLIGTLLCGLVTFAVYSWAVFEPASPPATVTERMTYPEASAAADALNRTDTLGVPVRRDRSAEEWSVVVPTIVEDRGPGFAEDVCLDMTPERTLLYTMAESHDRPVCQRSASDEQVWRLDGREWTRLTIDDSDAAW